MIFIKSRYAYATLVYSLLLSVGTSNAGVWNWFAIKPTATFFARNAASGPKIQQSKAPNSKTFNSPTTLNSLLPRINNSISAEAKVTISSFVSVFGVMAYALISLVWDDYDQLVRDNNRLRQQHLNSVGAHQLLSQQHNDLIQENNRLNGNHNGLVNDNERARWTINELTTNNAHLEEANQGLRDENGELLRNLRNTTADLENQSEFAKQQMENSALLKKTAAINLETARTQFQHQLHNQQQEKELVEQEIDILKKQKKKNKDSISDLESKITALKESALEDEIFVGFNNLFGELPELRERYEEVLNKLHDALANLDSSDEVHEKQRQELLLMINNLKLKLLDQENELLAKDSLVKNLNDKCSEKDTKYLEACTQNSEQLYKMKALERDFEIEKQRLQEKNMQQIESLKDEYDESLNQEKSDYNKLVNEYNNLLDLKNEFMMISEKYDSLLKQTVDKHNKAGNLVIDCENLSELFNTRTEEYNTLAQEYNILQEKIENLTVSLYQKEFRKDALDEEIEKFTIELESLKKQAELGQLQREKESQDEIDRLNHKNQRLKDRFVSKKLAFDQMAHRVKLLENELDILKNKNNLI